jgi:hypothetical protein
MSSSYVDVLNDYSSGRRSAREVLHVAKSHRGPTPHLLWDRALAPPNECLFEHCVRHFSEAKLLELLQTLIDDNPTFPRIMDEIQQCFLSVALKRAERPSVTSRVLLVLAVPGAHLRGGGSFAPPLHVACMTGRVDPDVIHRLIDLDPDVLLIADMGSKVPLH